VISVRITAIGLAAAMVAGCATPPPPAPPPKPPSYVVLLPNTDGTVGRITVSGAQGEVVLERPRQGAQFDGSPPFMVDEARIERDFGAALAARPVLPVSFLLYYEAGGTRLTPDSQALIPKVLEAVRSRPAPDVSVIGHTDSVGSSESNEKLGLERAQSIAVLIREAGLRAHDLTIASHGERNPLVATPDNTAEPRNRRVEITVR
jgi:outer membrane protein OmpA-like peptidoglycan-associated protein